MSISPSAACADDNNPIHNIKQLRNKKTKALLRSTFHKNRWASLVEYFCKKKKKQENASEIAFGASFYWLCQNMIVRYVKVQ